MFHWEDQDTGGVTQLDGLQVVALVSYNVTRMRRYEVRGNTCKKRGSSLCVGVGTISVGLQTFVTV